MPVTLLLPEGTAVPFCTAVVLAQAAGTPRAGLGGDVTMTLDDTRDDGARALARPPARRRVVSRLWRTAERQVAEIEARLAGGGDPAALERDAKTFAIIARTVRELVAIDAEADVQQQEKRRPHARKDTPAAEDETRDFGARDIETFRAELARRLDALRSDGAGAAP